MRVNWVTSGVAGLGMLAGLGGAAAPAGAATLGVVDLISTYNLVTEGDLNSSQEIEGRVFVGGNLTGGTLQVGIRNVPPGPSDMLVVRGNVAIGTLNMQNGSDLRVGGNATGTIEMNGGSLGTRTARFGGTRSGVFNQGTQFQNQAGNAEFQAGFPQIDFDFLRSESQRLAALPGTPVNVSNINNIPFLGGTVPTTLTVLTVDLSVLSTGGFTVNNQSAGTLLINVSGLTGTFAGNPLGGTAAAENVLWNFFEATSITVNTPIVGSVLAPFAAMSGFGGSTEGSVIARSVNLTNGELHSRPFAGMLPPPSVTPPPPPPVPGVIPLPAAGWLLLSGLVAMGALRRFGARA